MYLRANVRNKNMDAEMRTGFVRRSNKPREVANDTSAQHDNNGATRAAASCLPATSQRRTGTAVARMRWCLPSNSRSAPCCCGSCARNVSTLCKVPRGDVWRALLPKTLPAAGPVQVLLHPTRAIGRMRAVRSLARVGRTVTVAGMEEVSGMVAGTGKARVGVARVRLRTRKGRCEGMGTFNSTLGGRSAF